MTAIRKFLVPSLVTLAVFSATLWLAAQEPASAPAGPPMAASSTGSSAGPHPATSVASSNAASPAARKIEPVRSSAADRLEGEKRFKANCGRCHQAPPKFPPRVMATAIRHMRVRATITDDDMKLILKYMQQ
ncbi:MAG TPA: cytochrome c [Candidatus Sulfotelmatobacter sp.]|nr:cytochrome c [Candidatus Sulfotelmatobacter sp.]